MEVFPYVLEGSDSLESITLALALSDELPLLFDTCVDEDLALLFPSYDENQVVEEQALIRKLVMAGMDSNFDGQVFLLVTNEEQEMRIENFLNELFEEMDPIELDE